MSRSCSGGCLVGWSMHHMIYWLMFFLGVVSHQSSSKEFIGINLLRKIENVDQALGVLDARLNYECDHHEN